MAYYRDLGCKNINEMSFYAMLDDNNASYEHDPLLSFSDKGVYSKDDFWITFPNVTSIKVEYLDTNNKPQKGVTTGDTVNLKYYNIVQSINIQLKPHYAFLVDNSPLEGYLDDPTDDLNSSDSFSVTIKENCGYDYMDSYVIPFYGIGGKKLRVRGHTSKIVSEYSDKTAFQYNTAVAYGTAYSKKAKNFNAYYKTDTYKGSNVYSNSSISVTYDPTTKQGTVGENSVNGQLVIYVRTPNTPTTSSELPIKTWKSNQLGGLSDSDRDATKNHSGFSHVNLHDSEYQYTSCAAFSGSASVSVEFTYKIQVWEVTKKVSNYSLSSSNVSSFISSYCSPLKSEDEEIFTQVIEYSTKTSNLSWTGFDSIIKHSDIVQPSQYIYGAASVIADNPYADVSKDKDDSDSKWSGTFSMSLEYTYPHYRDYPGNIGIKKGTLSGSCKTTTNGGKARGHLILRQKATESYRGTLPSSFRVHFIPGTESSSTIDNSTVYYTATHGAGYSDWTESRYGCYFHQEGSHESNAFWLIQWKEIKN